MGVLTFSHRPLWYSFAIGGPDKNSEVLLENFKLIGPSFDIDMEG